MDKQSNDDAVILLRLCTEYRDGGRTEEILTQIKERLKAFEQGNKEETYSILTPGFKMPSDGIDKRPNVYSDYKTAEKYHKLLGNAGMPESLWAVEIDGQDVFFGTFFTRRLNIEVFRNEDHMLKPIRTEDYVIKSHTQLALEKFIGSPLL